MNRRGFLSRLGGTGAAVVAAGVVGAAPADATVADEFMQNGYRVKWRDFMPQANQNVVTGMWLAEHEANTGTPERVGVNDRAWVSTSLGQCYPTRPWEQIDMTLEKGWPRLTIFSTPEERAAVKQRALDALLKVLA